MGRHWTLNGGRCRYPTSGYRIRGVVVKRPDLRRNDPGIDLIQPAQQGGVADQQARGCVPQHVLELSASDRGVDRDCDRPGPSAAKDQLEQFNPILTEHGHSISHPNAGDP
jgi:hypothetical protein